MAKYEPRQRPRVAKTGGMGKALRQLTLLLISFACGYMFTSVYDYAHLNKLLNTNVFSSHAVQPVSASNKVAALPKPNFEFYTLLSEGQRAPTVVATTQQPVASVIKPTGLVVKPVQPALPVQSALPVQAATLIKQAINTELYYLQLASFPRQEEAFKMKASLAMKGFSVTVTQATQQGRRWYRVVAGPFPSKSDAQKVQTSLARRERIVGMILKMNA